MLSTSAGNRIERTSLTAASGLRPNTANFTMFGWCSIDAVNAAATAFACGVGNGSSNFMALRVPQNTTDATAIIRINGSGNTYTTDAIAVGGVNTQFFWAITRSGTTFTLRVNASTVTLTLPTTDPLAGSSDDIMVGQCRTAASPGATVSARWREFGYLNGTALSADDLDTLYNGGVCSHAVIAAFMRDRTDVLVYADFTRDECVLNGLLSHWARTGTPTFDANDSGTFPNNIGRAYLSRSIFTSVPGFVAGWDFASGTPDPTASPAGIPGFGPDGETYTDGTNLLECGTSAAIATDSTTLPAGINRRNGGLFGPFALHLESQAGYLRCLRENLSAGLLGFGSEETIVAIVRDCDVGAFPNTAITGKWFEGMNTREFALFRNLFLSQSAITHASSDGGPTPGEDFNEDVAKSGQNMPRYRMVYQAGTFKGSGESGELRAYINGVFEARTPDGSPPRGNPHTLPYGQLFSPTGSPPTDPWALWSGWTVGAVPTNLNSPTPPSAGNLPTLQNGPRNMVVYAIAVFDRALTEQELADIYAGLPWTNPASGGGGGARSRSRARNRATAV